MAFLLEHTPLRFLVEGIWRDEAFSFLLAKRPWYQMISLTASDFNPPLYYFILNVWMRVFGTSEIALRSLSILMYVVGVFFVYELFKVILKSRHRTAALYTLLFALNPLLLYYAFEARMYTMLFCFGMMSTFFYFKKQYRLYAIATVLGLYTHYFMAFILLGQGIHALLNHRGRIVSAPIFRTMMICGILFLPWALFFLSNNTSLDNEFWVSKLTLKDTFLIPGFLMSGIDKDYFVRTPYEPTIHFLLNSFTVFSIFSLGLYAVHSTVKETRNMIIYFMIQLLIPIVCVLILNDHKPLFVPRYLIFASTSLSMILLLAAYSIPIVLRTALLAFTLFFLLQFNSLQLEHRERGHMKSIVPQVQTMLGNQDAIFVTSELDLMEAQYYFGERRVFIFGRRYEDIPQYVGKVLIPEDRIATSYPVFPGKAIIISERKHKTVQVQSSFKPL